MQIRAAVLRHMGAPAPYARSMPLSIETVTLDPPGRGEVLIRIAAAGLCHSDLSVIEGNRPRPMPMALGHEAAGVVIETGAGIDDLVPGDHVIMVFMPSCGQCGPCAEGRPALCTSGAQANGQGRLLSGAIRIRDEDSEIHHHLGCSAFADHAVVSRRSLVKIDRDLPLDIAALFGCAVLTGVGAVVNTGGLRAGQTAAVVGLGGVGLAALLGALAAGASQVIAIDLSSDKLAFATGLGATAAMDARTPDIADRVRALTGGGVDMAFEMAGSAEALALSWAITRRGGTTVTAGLPQTTARLPVDMVALVAEERTLKGSYIGSCVPARDIPRYIALYRAGRLPVDRLISDTLVLDGVNHGFDALARGDAVRQLIRFP